MYTVINALAPTQVEQLLQLYKQTWWAKDRELADVQRMLSQSDLLFGLCDEDTQNLVAFARVLTDGVYRAIVFDVIVSENHRGQGLGLRLMQQVVSHPVLSQVECIQLFCLPDMLPFYKNMTLRRPSPCYWCA
ncbi:MAG: GNAT family N-acetyltransferase, partial [Leptolyngbyaceae cyanobacterium SM2_5_2]|nr:GNAT family N-acetyltransferase [Leptolyngbyaceae cyanobacterium SM2_5_2]